MLPLSTRGERLELVRARLCKLPTIEHHSLSVSALHEAYTFTTCTDIASVKALFSRAADTNCAHKN